MFSDLSKEDVLGLKWAAVLVAIVVVICIAMFASYLSSGPGYDRTTLCEYETKPSAHNVILVDTTDSLSSFQSKYVRTFVDGLIDRSSLGTRYSVYLISEEYGGISAPVFDMCQPSTGEEMNMLYENPKLAKRRFEEKFRVPFGELLSSFGESKTQDTSPLVEAISDLFKLDIYDEKAESYNLYLFSDLLQNSKRSSAYRGQEFPDISSCESKIQLTSIQVHMLERPDSEKHQSGSLTRAWAEYLAKCSDDLMFVRVRN